MKLWIYVFVNATRIYLLLELNAEIFSWKKIEASLNALLLKRHFVFGNRTWKGTLIFPTIVPGLKPMYITYPLSFKFAAFSSPNFKKPFSIILKTYNKL